MKLFFQQNTVCEAYSYLRITYCVYAPQFFTAFRHLSLCHGREVHNNVELLSTFLFISWDYLTVTLVGFFRGQAVASYSSYLSYTMRGGNCSDRYYSMTKSKQLYYSFVNSQTLVISLVLSALTLEIIVDCQKKKKKVSQLKRDCSLLRGQVFMYYSRVHWVHAHSVLITVGWPWVTLCSMKLLRLW